MGKLHRPLHLKFCAVGGGLAFPCLLPLLSMLCFIANVGKKRLPEASGRHCVALIQDLPYVPLLHCY